MNPTTPTSGMSQGATFMRPGAMAWGQIPTRSRICSTSLAEGGSGFRCPMPARSPTGPRWSCRPSPTWVVTDGTPVRVGRPPADPLPLLSEVRAALTAIPGARQTARAWLSVSGQGEGLVISVTLDDPASQDAHQEVLDAVQRAVAAVPELRFPIDVTFPGESEPDQVDAWISAYAEPFYIRA